jgi:hypothetical protein
LQNPGKQTRRCKRIEKSEVNALSPKSAAEEASSSTDIPKVKKGKRESYLDFIIKYIGTRGEQTKIALKNERSGAKSQKLTDETEF